MGWSLMAAGSESISPLQNEPTLPLLESTWDVQHMAVHHDAAHENMTGATTGAMTEVMTEATTEGTIVTMSAMMTENTDRTDADLHPLITAEDIAHVPAHVPTHPVATENGQIHLNLWRLVFFLLFFDGVLYMTVYL